MIYGEYIFPATCLADDREAMARGWEEIVRCKDCMYKPTQHEEDDETIIDFPVPFKCPCECEDPWYDWVPEDDWFCGNAKRRKEE